MTPEEIAAANATKIQELSNVHQAYLAADRAYRLAEEYILSGELAAYICVAFASRQGDARDHYVAVIEDLKRKLEERNIKIREVADLMRQRVMLEPSKWRGAKGKPDVLTLGDFKTTSVTGRSFDAATLIDQTQKLGLLESLMSVTTRNKDGQEEKIVRQEYVIDYEGTLQWLTANKLDGIVEAAYDEKEKTPQVKGPKPLAFLGDTKDK